MVRVHADDVDGMEHEALSILSEIAAEGVLVLRQAFLFGTVVIYITMYETVRVVHILILRYYSLYLYGHTR